MRIEITETELYKFTELSEEAQQSALESLYDLNVDYNWWEFTYDDAVNIGCEINGFDLDRSSNCDLTCNDTEATAYLILDNHGADCESFKTATSYLVERAKILKQYSDENEYELDQELDDCGIDFTQSLSEDYRLMLQREYDYLTSKTAIIETIESNDYEFTVNGELH